MPQHNMVLRIGNLLVVTVIMASIHAVVMAFGAHALHGKNHALYACSIDYEVSSRKGSFARMEAGNAYEVLWSYKGLCTVNVRDVNKTYVEVWLSPANDTSVKLIAFLVYRKFNYAWLIAFNNTVLSKPLFVGFTPVYSTLPVNRSLNNMRLVYQDARVVVDCGYFTLGDYVYKNVWSVSADNVLTVVYGVGPYPLFAESKIRMPDGAHVISIEIKRMGVSVDNVCAPRRYIDWGGLVMLLVLASMPVAVFLMLRRARR